MRRSICRLRPRLTGVSAPGGSSPACRTIPRESRNSTALLTVGKLISVFCTISARERTRCSRNRSNTCLRLRDLRYSVPYVAMRIPPCICPRLLGQGPCVFQILFFGLSAVLRKPPSGPDRPRPPEPCAAEGRSQPADSAVQPARENAPASARNAAECFPIRPA